MKRTIAIGCIGALFVLASCGSSKSRSSPSSENTFVLSEFTIMPPTNALHTGKIVLSANNLGGEVHELVIVRAASLGSLPMKTDGSVDEGKVPSADKVGAIDAVAGRSRKSGTFDLTAGTYVAFCNVVDNMMGSSTSMMNGGEMGSSTGHVHFAQGMHVTFTVT